MIELKLVSTYSMKVQIFDYKPSYIKLPSHLKKNFTEDYPKWKNQKENLEKDPTYDNYSLFYDVFFDLSRKNIWTIGPPFFSLQKKIFPMKILYQGKNIPYKYHQYNKKPTKAYCANCFQIPAKKIKENNPTLTFIGKNYSIQVKVATFPNINKQPKLTLTILQKNYSAEYIVDWVLWHYRLHNFRRILFYDNGSQNIQQVKQTLQNLNTPNLEIIFIDWPYYYGGRSPRFDDCFAQQTQLNHTLKLHYKLDNIIANWDLDEFLISTIPIEFKTVKKIIPSFPIVRYDIIDVAQKPPTSIRDCLTRYKQPCNTGKYCFIPKSIRYISNPHFISLRESYMYYIFRYIKKYYDLIKKNHFYEKKIYLIHTQPIKVFWKRKLKANERVFQTTFDLNLHIKDQNIQEHLEKSGL